RNRSGGEILQPGQVPLRQQFCRGGGASGERGNVFHLPVFGPDGREDKVEKVQSIPRTAKGSHEKRVPVRGMTGVERVLHV
ncbi:unnamed protein product, partial [Amoebophrya sp. A120]